MAYQKVVTNRLGLANLTVANDALVKHITDIDQLQTGRWRDGDVFTPNKKVFNVGDTFEVFGVLTSTIGDTVKLFKIHTDGTLQRMKTISYAKPDESVGGFTTGITTAYTAGAYIAVYEGPNNEYGKIQNSPIFYINAAAPAQYPTDDWGIPTTWELQRDTPAVTDSLTYIELLETGIVAKGTQLSPGQTLNFLDFTYGNDEHTFDSLEAKIYKMNADGVMQRFKTLPAPFRVPNEGHVDQNQSVHWWGMTPEVISSAFVSGSYVVVVRGLSPLGSWVDGHSTMFSIKA